MGMRWTRIPSRWGVTILLGMLDAEEIGIGSGRLGLWLVVCAFVLLILKWPEWLASKGQRLEGKKEKERGLGREGKRLPLLRSFSFRTFPLPSPPPLLRLSRWLWNALRREWDCWVDGGLRSLNRSFSWHLVSPIYWHLHLLLHSIK